MAKDWTFWLQMTNLVLVLVTVLAGLVVTSAVGWELWIRRANKARAARSLDTEMWAMSRRDFHTFSVPGLGLTMADGGEKIEPSKAQSSEQKLRRK
ncbi:MAG: hypothetical protein ABSD64_01055 [Terriglobales bacterium]|jgi:hypothetical protein